MLLFAKSQIICIASAKVIDKGVQFNRFNWAHLSYFNGKLHIHSSLNLYQFRKYSDADKIQSSQTLSVSRIGNIMVYVIYGLDIEPAHFLWLISFSLTHQGRDKMAAIFQTKLSNAFFLTKDVRISIKMSLKFIRIGPISNIFLALVQRMAWRRPGDKPLYEPMLAILSTRICVNRPQYQ